jgi:hypothetical protein
MWIFSPAYVFLKQKLRYFHFDYNMACFHFVFDDYVAGYFCFGLDFIVLIYSLI